MAGQRPSNKEELYLTFVIPASKTLLKKIFGITKYRFQILETPIEFIMDVDVKIVLVITGLPNFIQSH